MHKENATRCFTIALSVSSQSGLSLGWMLLWSSGTKSSSSECTEDFIILERRTEGFDTQWQLLGSHTRSLLWCSVMWLIWQYKCFYKSRNLTDI